MIKPKINAKVEYVKLLQLNMDSDTAKWLMSLVQNPIFEDETAEEEERRRIIFTVLKETLDAEF